jgi:glycosyltransferase involved in cell wall biosynthesis
LNSSTEVHPIVFGDRFSIGKNRIVVRYPIRFLNWLYRLLIENVVATGYGYALNANRLVMMGNFPSLFWFRNQIVFFHNTLYLEDNKKSDSLKIRLEKKLFKIAIKFKKPTIYVQTAYVESLVRAYFKEECVIKVVGSPIAKTELELSQNRKLSENQTLNFIYPAFYYPHKNHHILLRNEKLLEELNCKIFLTIKKEDVAPEFSDLTRVKYFGTMEKRELLNLYANSDALIFPSLNESFGLPLLEAGILKLPIIAPDLRYVHSVVSNFYSYQANSDILFCNAVRECVLDIRNRCAKKANPLVNTDVVVFIDDLIK